MHNVVLDASALLAAAYREKGAEVVNDRLEAACISTVNFTEVVTRIIRTGVKPEALEEAMEGFLPVVIPFDEEQALLAATLYPQTKPLGLSLGDRACLALAMTHKLPVLTADKSWASLKLGIKIETIR